MAQLLPISYHIKPYHRITVSRAHHSDTGDTLDTLLIRKVREDREFRDSPR